MSDSNSIIVPFGKYKGQPIEIMLSDTSYISYQKQQPGFMKWLEENHVTIYNIFTTGAQQVQDTPEHNKLQARFLDKKFQLAFFDAINGYTVREDFLNLVKSTQKDIDSNAPTIIDHNDKLSLVETSLREKIQLIIEQLQTKIDKSAPDTFESYCSANSYLSGWSQESIRQRFENSEKYRLQEIKNNKNAIEKLRAGNTDNEALNTINDKIKKLNDGIERYNHNIHMAKKYLSIYQSIVLDPSNLGTTVTFEHGYDVYMRLQQYSECSHFADYVMRDQYRTLRIEIKPTVGDNYPAVLRQMKINQPEYDIEKYQGREIRREFCGIDALLIGTFESESIDVDQLRGIFGRYKVVLLSEVEEKLASYK
jgi:hypothetical protein